MSSSTEPLTLSLLDSIGVLLSIRSAHKAAWQNVIDLGRKSRGSEASQFSLFTLVLLHQTGLVRLGHILPALASDLVNRPQNDLLGCTGTGAAVLVEVANITASHVSSTIDSERDAVRDFSAPSLGVKTWVVERLLTSVYMDPSSLVLRVYLSPYMVLGVPHPTNSRADSAAEHAETVGPLASSASAGLQ